MTAGCYVSVENLPGIAFIISEEGCLFAANTKAESFFHAVDHQLLGKPLAKSGLSAACVARHEAYDRAVLEKDQALLCADSFEMRGLPSVEVLLTKSPCQLPAGKKGVLTIAYDLSAHLANLQAELDKAKHSAEIANQAKVDMMANMIHDLRAPLNSILGSAQILNMQEHYSDQQEFIDAIFHSGQTLVNIVEDLGDLPLEDNAPFSLKIESFDVVALIDEVINIMAHQARQKGLEILATYSDDLPEVIETSPSALRRIMFNLISNAVQFTSKGSIQVRASMEAQSSVDGLVLSIIDSGIGIPRSEQERIFERGVIVGERNRGSGLGLHIVKKLVHELQGNISITSAPGKGTTVTFFLPLTVASDQRLQHQVTRLAHSGLRVLVVGKTLSHAEKLAALLPIQNAVTVATEVAAALNMSFQDNDPFRVVLFDDQIEIEHLLQIAQLLNNQGVFERVLLTKLTMDASEVGRKNDFYQIHLPVTNAINLQVALQTAWDDWLRHKAQANIRRNRTVRVLLVENDESSQQVAQAMLESMECTVDIAATGEEACEWFAKQGYDIVFLDIGLDDISGFEVAQRFRQMESSQSRVPIVALTAHALAHYEAKSLQAGMDGFLTKPVLYEDFQRVLKRFIYNS